MPINKVPRYKVLHCHATKSRHVIARIDRRKYKGGHVPVSVIFAAIRRHYKRKHPVLFKRMVRRAQYARRKT